jgi:rhodanese-related sulfurtransferase
MKSLLRDKSAQIIDARATDRFEGKAPEPRPGLRSGHIPGARNVPFGKLLNQDGTLKSAPELQRLFEQAGIDLNKPVVTSCGSGITASVLALGLAEIGHRRTSVYDGSWSEWGADQSLPMKPVSNRNSARPARLEMSKRPRKQKDETRLAHAGRDPSRQHGFVNTPIYRGSTVIFPTVARLEANIRTSLTAGSARPP